MKMVMIVEFLGEWKPFEKQLFCQLVIMTMIMIHHGKPFASKRVGINNNYKKKPNLDEVKIVRPRMILMIENLSQARVLGSKTLPSLQPFRRAFPSIQR